jgi:arylsulfatase A-like enzyme
VGCWEDNLAGLGMWGINKLDMNYNDRTMKSNLSRREFLKFSSLLPLLYTLQPSQGSNSLQQASDKPNILILVFDAWSSTNISLYGYPRKTTPNLDKLAEKAIVFHNHYAGGHFTSPGTASLLTGTTPWLHQAFDFNSTVIDALSRKSIFNALPDYYRFAYTHNPLVDTLLQQFMVDIDSLKPLEDLYLKDALSLLRLFKNDIEMSTISQNRSLNQLDDGFSYSLYLSRLFTYISQKKSDALSAKLPRGITNYGDFHFYILEDALDWLSNTITGLPEPFLGYHHFYPPHDPYYTRVEFLDAFASDSYRPISKEAHFLQNKSRQVVKEQQRWYDEFILYVDSEIARLLSNLEQKGILENTWIFLTTDHGEMFERNILGHSAPVYYQPLIRIPLVVFRPGGSRVDIYDNTSAIDLLPTICQVAGQQVPGWSEGRVLPPLNNLGDSENREITSIQVEALDDDGYISEATSFILRGRYKLTWYLGYEQLAPDREYIELYDLAEDPEELDNLSAKRSDLVNELVLILESKLSDLNKSFRVGV